MSCLISVFCFVKGPQPTITPISTTPHRIALITIDLRRGTQRPHSLPRPLPATLEAVRIFVEAAAGTTNPPVQASRRVRLAEIAVIVRTAPPTVRHHRTLTPVLGHRGRLRQAPEVREERLLLRARRRRGRPTNPPGKVLNSSVYLNSCRFKKHNFYSVCATVVEELTIFIGRFSLVGLSILRKDLVLRFI